MLTLKTETHHASVVQFVSEFLTAQNVIKFAAMLVKIILILSTILFTQSVIGNVVSRDAAVVARKQEFGKRAQTDFLSLSIGFWKRTAEDIKNGYNLVIGDLPLGNEYRNFFENGVLKINEFASKLEMVDMDMEKLKKSFKTFIEYQKYIRKFDDISSETTSKEDVKKIIAKHSADPYTIHFEKRKAFLINVGEKWQELYADLNEEDLKASPEYTKINETVTEAIKSEDFEKKTSLYEDALQNIYSIFFNDKCDDEDD